MIRLGVLSDDDGKSDITQTGKEFIMPEFLTFFPRRQITGLPRTRITKTHRDQGDFFRIVESFTVDIETRIGWAADLGAHRTSMLQDLDQGRPMEIDALVGSVQELGRITGTPTPTIDTVLALIQLRGKVAGLYPA